MRRSHSSPKGMPAAFAARGSRLFAVMPGIVFTSRATIRSPTQIRSVRDARVEIALPDRARITLVEREAAGRWITSNRLEWFVDADGVLFPSADERAAPDLRVFDERRERRAGEQLDPAVVRVALRLAAIAPGELRADATSPRAILTSTGLVLRFASGWEIRFGGPESFDEKLDLAKHYLRDHPERRLDYVDVRSPDRIVVSPQ